MTPKARHSLATVSAIAALSVTAVSLPAQDITAKDLLEGLANPSRWLTHSGDYAGHRFSPLTQVTPANAGQLAAQWTFQTGVANKFEATPIVIDGTLYVTGALNHAWAIDGRTGRQIWHYQRTLPEGLKVCCGMVKACEQIAVWRSASLSPSARWETGELRGLAGQPEAAGERRGSPESLALLRSAWSA